MSTDTASPTCAIDRSNGLERVAINCDASGGNCDYIPVGIDAESVLAASRGTTSIHVGPPQEDGSNRFAAGQTAGGLTVSHDGAAVYTLPLRIPAGHGGWVPRSFALMYNSQAGNGVAGAGWTLAGTSQITRCSLHTAYGDPEIGAFQWSEPTQVFYPTYGLCLDGKRLIPDWSDFSAQVSEYRLEDDPAPRIRVSGWDADGVPLAFEVEDGAGNTLTYGAIGGGGTSTRAHIESRIVEYSQASPGVPGSNPLRTTYSASPKRYGWALSRIQNRFNQSASFDYAPDPPLEKFGVDQRLEFMLYDGATVQFLYEPRPDPTERYVRGMRLVQLNRLRGVRISVAGRLVTEYRLSYRLRPTDPDRSSLTRRSRLASLQECDGQGACKAPVVFRYQDPDPTFQKTSDLPLVNFWDRANTYRLAVTDLNDDGRDDLIMRNRTNPESTFWEYALSTGTGYEPFRPMSGLPQGNKTITDERGPFFVEGIGALEKWFGEQKFTVFSEMILADVNADGRPELGLWGDDVTGYKFWNFDVATNVASEFAPVLPRTMPYIADINGDSLAELITKDVVNRRWRVHVQSATQPGTWPSFFELDGGGRIPGVSVPNISGVLASDFDGDGRSELLLNRQGEPFYSALAAARTDLGSDAASLGFTDAWLFQYAAEFGRYFFLDANGDGLADPVRSALRPSTPEEYGVTPEILENTGNGFRVTGLPYPIAQAKFGESSQTVPTPQALDNGIRAADLDGDGRQELVVLGDYLRCSTWWNQATGTVSPECNPTQPQNSFPRRDPFVLRLSYENGAWAWIAEPLVGVEYSPPIRSGTWMNGVQCGVLQADRNWGWKLSQIVDVDGDGLPEILTPRVVNCGDIRLQVYKRQPLKPDLLSSVTDSFGARTEVTYRPMSDANVHTPGERDIHWPDDRDCSYPLTCARKGQWLVATVAKSTDWVEPPGMTTERHHYRVGRADLNGRGWLGFAEHDVVNDDLGVSVRYAMDNVTRVDKTTSFSLGRPHSYPFAGQVNAETTTYRTDTSRSLSVSKTRPLHNATPNGLAIVVRPSRQCESRWESTAVSVAGSQVWVPGLPFMNVCTSYEGYDSIRLSPDHNAHGWIRDPDAGDNLPAPVRRCLLLSRQERRTTSSSWNCHTSRGDEFREWAVGRQSHHRGPG